MKKEGNMLLKNIKDTVLVALAGTAIGFCAKYATLPTRVSALEQQFQSVDRKLDILIARGQ